MSQPWRTLAAMLLAVGAPGLAWCGDSTVPGWRQLSNRKQPVLAPPRSAPVAPAPQPARLTAPPRTPLNTSRPPTAAITAASNLVPPIVTDPAAWELLEPQPAVAAVSSRNPAALRPAVFQENAPPDLVPPPAQPAAPQAKPAAPVRGPAPAARGFDGLASEAPPLPTPLASDPLWGDSCASASCAGGTCCDDVCGEFCPAKNYARVEYLMWWGLGRNIPPLVTTSPAATPRDDAGVLPNAQVLFGDDRAGGDLRSGGRVTFGRVVGPTGDMSVNGRLWGLEDSSETFERASAALPILARPFFNVGLGVEDAQLVAYPGVVINGSIRVQSKSDALGAEAFVRDLWISEDGYAVELIAGYQFTRLDDSLVINNIQTSIDPLSAIPVGTVLDVLDSFRTKNEFHGAQLGAATNWRRGRWNLEALVKVGFGNMRQTVEISGRTISTLAPNNPVQAAGGLLARDGRNLGLFERDVFTFIPEGGLTLSYELTPYWSLTAGYSFLYWNDVAWAGDQIDLGVNLTDPLVGDPRPAFVFQDTDFWLQGLSFGVEGRF